MNFLGNRCTEKNVDWDVDDFRECPVNVNRNHMNPGVECYNAYEKRKTDGKKTSIYRTRAIINRGY